MPPPATDTASKLAALVSEIQDRVGALKDGKFGVQTAELVLKALTPRFVIPKRRINQLGLSLVKFFEGCYLTAYRDPVGIWTIGYGHTGLKHKDGTVKEGRIITYTEAENLLRYDMGVFEDEVTRYVQVPINENQFSALVSFDFNTGGLGSSTLLKLLNQGKYQDAAEQFLRWDKAGGKTLAGLTKRRKAERQLFLTQPTDAISHTMPTLVSNEQGEAGCKTDLVCA